MTIIEVTMPKLGESVTEGTIARWLVAVGDAVRQYAPLCEVITDKVTAEVPATEAGVLEALLVPEGETVPVGTPIARLRLAAGADAGGKTLDGEANAEDRAIRAGDVAAFDAHRRTNDAGKLPRGRYSPAVRRLAEAYQVDLGQIRGTGEHGRITRRDVLSYIAAVSEAREVPGVASETAPPASTSMPVDSTLPSASPISGTPAASQPSVRKGTEPAGSTSDTGDVRRPISPVRRRIAERMTESKHTAPHAWMMVEVDVTRLVRYRQAVKDEFYRREGFNLTFLPFFLKAVTIALRRHPVLNASWDGDAIVLKRAINLSVAVAHDDVLYVPVIKGADGLSVVGLARALNDLVQRTKSGRLAPSDIEGGTFTVNNTGAFGSVLSMPIINPPQAAILSIEAITKRPVVVDEATIAIRDMVNLTLSLDHRVMDGAAAGAFLKTLKTLLEPLDEETFAI